jgi:hypothetical protein
MWPPAIGADTDWHLVVLVDGVGLKLTEVFDGNMCFWEGKINALEVSAQEESVDVTVVLSPSLFVRMRSADLVDDGNNGSSHTCAIITHVDITITSSSWTLESHCYLLTEFGRIDS